MATETGQVLIVDDDELARLELARCVERSGHMATFAENGGQGLELLRSRRFDLVLLDLIMPGVDGFDVLGQIKQDTELSAIPVIVITAVDDPANTTRCMEMGADSHFKKPIDSDTLVGRIKSLLE